MDEEKIILDSLLEEAKKPNASIRKVVASAFCAGKRFQEEKIKKGIAIALESLHS